jgi:CRISPR system Cascade subunit CasE
MIYLSSLYLNPRSRAVRKDVADCREMHRTVLRAFPQARDGMPPGDAFGVLYRLEESARGRVRLLVQSKEEPQWGGLEAFEGYLDPDAPGVNPEVKEVGSRYDSLESGQILRFRLRANPTRRVGKSGEAGWVGKRVDLRRETDQLAWLHRKGEAGGFAVVSVRAELPVPSVRVIPEGTVVGNRQQDGRTMAFGSVLFEGLIRVTHPYLFRRTLSQGLGSGKAYGFGLLSIAPG